MENLLEVDLFIHIEKIINFRNEKLYSFNFNDASDLENKIRECQNDGGVYGIIIEPYSASLLESFRILL